MLSIVLFYSLFVPASVGAAEPSTPPATPSPHPLAQLEFRSLGPAVSGGRLGAVAGTDADPALYYVGAAGGGVWKTTNGGQSFQPVFDSQRSPSIGAIAIDPRQPNTVWVGTGEGNPRNDVSEGDGVYRSGDGGKTWQHVLTLQNTLITKILVNAKNSNCVLVAVLGDPFADSTDRGVYQTLDGGRSWHKRLFLSARSGASDLAGSASDPQTVYAGMWDMRRTGWSLQSGGADDGLFKSTDGGETWSRVEGRGLPTDEHGRIGLAIAPSDPKRVYALIQSKQGILWRSDDDGHTWQLVSRNTNINERPFYFSHVFVDPQNADHVWSTSVHLTVSTDGGKTFVQTGRGIHGDNHAMWNASDGKRIIEGNDGGPAFSLDGGTSWEWRKVLPISQPYHIGFDLQNPYHVCAPLQDNGVWCAPSNGLSGSLSASQWRDMGGGDGTWAMPDPVDPGLVWSSSGGGNFAGEIDILDTRTGESRTVSPYLRDQNVVDPKNLAYRFNWETPLTFDPFDPRVAYVGGNVLFSSRDRGYRWQKLSGDLTRNYALHQVVTGGITLDGTGAETSDTILYIEPSTVRRGQLWVGTDDGFIQLSRDAGKTWRNVTPATVRDAQGNAAFGRFASLSASSRNAGTLYAAYDLHMVGDRTPHIYATHDYGTHWKDVATATMAGDGEVRSVREDPKNPNVVFAGLERGLWASFDAGASWESVRLNLPASSVRDIRVHPVANDLILATHGRGIWILDDATALQQLVRARRQAEYIFPVRTAFQYQLHTYVLSGSGYGTRADGANPPYGAIISYWLGAPSKSAPAAEIADASGRVIRRFAAKDLSNQAGLDRFTWDLAEAKPADWQFTPKWNRGFDTGPDVLPGRYTALIHVNGRTLRAPIVVREDPRMHWSVAELTARRALLRELYSDFNLIDEALNVLSTVVNEAPLRAADLSAGGNGTLATTVTELGSQAFALLLTITQNPQNDQDNDFLKDILRERLQTTLGTFDSFAPPTRTQVFETHSTHVLTLQRMREFSTFVNGPLRSANMALSAAGKKPLTLLTAAPPNYSP